MKKTPQFCSTVCAAIICAASLTNSSQAALLAYEGFAYPAAANSLVGKNGGSGFGEAWNGEVETDVVSGSIPYTDGVNSLITTGNSAFTDNNGFGTGTLRNFTSVLSGTIWVSLTIDGASPGSGFGGLTLLAAGGNDNGGLAFGQLFNGSLYGVFGEQQPNDGDSSVESNVNSGTAAMIAANINLTAGTATWYVNPDGLGAGAAPTGADFTGAFTFTPMTVEGIGLRGNAQFNIDEVRVGTTWADVSPVPEPTSAMLLGLGAFGLLAGRRSRRVQS